MLGSFGQLQKTKWMSRYFRPETNVPHRAPAASAAAATAAAFVCLETDT